VDLVQPASFSVFRGQSRSGQGEGPEKTVPQGEQYLQVDRALYRAELLDTIRPWMTLDSDPADHQRLNDDLEAWSLFAAGDYLFVVRLASAGTYDRRAAYFAHGRAWPAAAIPAGVDPGLNLGRAEAFDRPWRDDRPHEERREELPGAVRPEQVAAEPKTAELFLGHLHQALTTGNPLIIAAPIADFARGSALHALVSVARAGLPASLRNQCRIRVYSRFPELFLRHLGANLVVVPEDSATAALTARPNATLIDRQGRMIAGKELGTAAEEYGAAVVERAVAIPGGMAYFSERLGSRTPADSREIPVTYNVAFALAGPAAHRAELLRFYLPGAAAKLGPGLDWQRLVRPDEWREFPAAAIVEQLLAGAGELPEARRQFLAALEDGAGSLQLRVDDRLAEWWDPRDAGKVRRLLELLAHDPPLVSAEAAAERTAGIELERLPPGRLLARALHAEANSGRLERRNPESAQLARAVGDPEVFRALTEATSASRLSPDWARAYVGSASPDALVDAAARWLAEPRFFGEAWGDVSRSLLDRLRVFPEPPAALAPPLRSTGQAMAPAADLETYLRLADVLTRIDGAEGDALMQRLWHALPSLTEAQKRCLEGIVFNDEWRCARTDRIDLRILLRLAASFEQEESDTRLREVVDARMLLDPERTTAALVESGWWYFWRVFSQLRTGRPDEAAVLRRSALAWLSSEAWTTGPKLEATMEAWETALGDIPAGLSGAELAGLRHRSNGRRRWPWVPPFEEQQLTRLIAMATDLGGLAELAEAVSRDESAPAPGDGASVFKQSTFAGEVPAMAFARLLANEYRTSAEPLSLAHSAYLCAHAGHRAERALEVRIESVAKHFHVDPGKAVAAAGDPKLWGDARFLQRVAGWMSGRGSLEAIGAMTAAAIDARIDGEPDSRPSAVPASLVRGLVAAGFDRAARLLDPKRQGEIQSANLTADVVEALVNGESTDSCWRRLGEAVRLAEKTRQEPHPLSVVGEGVRRADLPADKRRSLASHGWRTFAAAGTVNPELLAPLQSSPARAPSLTPLFDVVASILGPGAVGRAAALLAGEVADPAWRDSILLWRNVLHAMRVYRRHGAVRSADDRDQTAIALLFASVETAKQESALWSALELEGEGEPGWDVLSEFGEGTL
jgi:hypothetical protein